MTGRQPSLSHGLDWAIRDARRIFDAALSAYRPDHVFILTSGGNDSAVPLHLLHEDPRVTGAVHIDTGIKVDAVEPHVRATCEALGLPLLIYRATENTKADGTPDPQRYEDFVEQHGFPGPAQHSRMYQRLKERQIERLCREHEGTVALVTGVRKSESRRRMGTVEETQKRGRTIWVAPITNWTEAHMLEYRATFSVPESPVSRVLGMSGECLCGAFAKPGELAVLKRHFPEAAERIERLQEGKPWGWEEGPPQAWFRYQRGQDFLDESFMPLCVGCDKRWRTFKEGA